MFRWRINSEFDEHRFGRCCVPMGTMAARMDYFSMKSIGRDHYDERAPVSSIYAGGLRNVFAACHEPLPSKMEELIDRLREHEDPRDDAVN